MNKQVNLLNQVPSSKLYFSQMGYQFDIQDEFWKLDGSITINLSRIAMLEPVSREGFRLTLCRYAQELSAAVNSQLLCLLCSYYQVTNENTITISGLSNWKAKLGSVKEDWLSAFRTFLYSWYSWGYPGISEDVANYLYSFRLRGGVKGKSVKNACPYSGPFSTCEQSALLEWASNSFAKNIISLTQFAIVMTLSFTGRRMVQIRSLRGGDLSTSNQNTVAEFYVNVPRVKQRGYGFRETFKQITIVSELYLVLMNQFEESLKYIENYYNEKIPVDVRMHIPVFINKDVLMAHHCLSDLILMMKEMPDYLHITKKNVAFELRQLQKKCTARSERTGEIIRISPRRFRYTKGTNLSRRGVQGVALAEALDHSDTQHISVYVQNTVETAYFIDEVMASSLAPLAQAFAGQLIQSERDALRSEDPHSRVKHTGGTNIGNCGSYSFCASGYRSCYTCINFQPWKDAPHENVRSEILAERERQQAAGVSDNVIRSTDRLLLAVEQVIQMCKQENTGGENE